MKTTSPGFINDFSSLDRLRAGIGNDEEQSLRAAAEQFESIFTQMLFKSMRQANEAFESDLMSSSNTKFFEQMHDEQMASELSSNGTLGLADLIVEQLGAVAGISETEKKPEAEAEQTFLRPQAADPSTRLARSDSERELQVRQQFAAAIDAARKPDPMASQGSESAVAVAKPVVKAPRFDSPQSFVDAMKPYAMKASKALGVDPGVLIAQAALETGWGQKVITNAADHSHNLFNIKADKRWDGKKIATQTLEFHQGIPVKETAAFRSYDNYGESFDDYVQFLKQNPRYQKALEQTQQPEAFVRELHQAGYATDPKYSEKVLQVWDKVSGIMDK